MKKITKYDFTYEESRFIEDFSDAVEGFCDTVEHCWDCPIKQYCAYHFNDEDGETISSAIVGLFKFFKEHEVKE